jgi:sialate O-acetylesterase
VIKLATVFRDGMVLQQGVVSRLYGFAPEESKVHLSIERQALDEASALENASRYGIIYEEDDVTERDGYFQIKLPALEASFDKYIIKVSSTEYEIILQDVLVGEVWLAAGQDNMAQTVRESDVDQLLDKAINLENIRFFQMNENGLSASTPSYSPYPLGEAADAFWLRGNQVHLVKDVSAAAFSFAWHLSQSINVPIGIINAACPGTHIHSWLPREVLEKDPILKSHVRELKLYRDDDTWNLESIERTVKEEGLSEEEAFARHRSVRPQTAALLDGRQPDAVESSSTLIPRPQVRRTMVHKRTVPLLRVFDPKNQPGAMFNHKLSPLVGMALRGVLWLHGESDVDSPDFYSRALEELVASFKELFIPADESLHFIYAHLQSYLYRDLGPYDLAVFNEMLTRCHHCLDVSCGLVTQYDLPLDYQKDESVCLALTPWAKLQLGARMALIARGLCGEEGVSTSAPEPVSLEQVGNKWMINFTDSAVQGGGLRLPAGETELKGFSICGENRVFIPAQARILYGVRVLVWHDEIDNPESLTYAFDNFNSHANLYGSNGLPVVPFRLDLGESLFLKPTPWADMDQLEQMIWKKSIDDDEPRVKKTDWPDKENLWQVWRGRGKFSFLEARDIDSWKGLCLEYRNADDRILEFGPYLDYESAYPPLNLEPFSRMNLILKNPDHRDKRLILRIEDANGVKYEASPQIIKDDFRDQNLLWRLDEITVNRAQIVRLSFQLSDRGGTGAIHFHRIRFSGFDPSVEFALHDYGR